MKKLLLIIPILIVFSCNETQRRSKEPTDSLTQEEKNVDEQQGNVLNDDDCHTWLNDSILATGAFVRYIRADGLVKIEWGNKTFKRILKQTYDCNGAPSWMPTIEWATNSYIGLDYGCGSPCWGTIILPLNPTDSVVQRMYDFDQDIERHLIVYLGTDNYNILTIENWKTGKKQEIKTKITCKPAFFGYCIDSLKLNKDMLFVQWVDGDERKKRADNIKLEL